MTTPRLIVTTARQDKESDQSCSPGAQASASAANLPPGQSPRAPALPTSRSPLTQRSGQHLLGARLWGAPGWWLRGREGRAEFSRGSGVGATVLKTRTHVSSGMLGLCTRCLPAGVRRCRAASRSVFSRATRWFDKRMFCSCDASETPTSSTCGVVSTVIFLLVYVELRAPDCLAPEPAMDCRGPNCAPDTLEGVAPCLPSGLDCDGRDCASLYSLRTMVSHNPTGRELSLG